MKPKKDAGKLLASAKAGPALLLKLEKYDHLNFMAFKKNYEHGLGSLQEPDNNVLLEIIRNELLSAKKEKEALKILGRLRHVARLFYTEETWSGEEGALTLLGYELQFVKNWNENYKKPLQWKSVSKKEYAAAERIVKTSAAFVEYSLPGEWWDKISAQTPFIGECLSVRERIVPASYSFRFLKDDYPSYYIHYKEHFQKLKKFCFSAQMPPKDISPKSGLLENVSIKEIYD